MIVVNHCRERAPSVGLRALTAFVSCAVMTVACASTQTPTTVTQTPSPTTPLRLTPIELTLTVLNDGPVELASLRGRAVLIAAVNTQNLASQALLRSLERVARAHPETLSVIAIVGDPFDPATAQIALGAWRDVLDLRHVRLAPATDEIRRGASELGPIERTPTLFFINRVGAIVQRLEGFQSVSALETLIAPALPGGR